MSAKMNERVPLVEVLTPDKDFDTLSLGPISRSLFSGPASAVQVITSEDDHSFNLDKLALKKILLDRKVKDRKVIVISVAGECRTGKSFLLNFFLRCLYSKGSENWMGDVDTPLKGFHWRRGAERNTTGILMWSEPFEVNLPSGEKACVLLMDTQGSFDSHSTITDCGTVFALSTMLSSVQVYNIMSDIRENDLQNLQLFAGYGRLALTENRLKPFQDLLFLVRDWQWLEDYELGLTGGEKLVKDRLEIKGDHHQQLMDLRLNLYSCFSNIGGCLLPHPGKTVATSTDFDGRLSDIDDDFKEHVEKFVSSLLLSENLVVKKINGTEITGSALFEHFKAYFNTFQGDELPNLHTIFEANAIATNSTAVEEAKELYTEQMDLETGGHWCCILFPILQQKHDEYKRLAVQRFRSINKFGSEEQSRNFQDQLEKQLDALFATYRERNSEKNPFKKGCCCG